MKNRRLRLAKQLFAGGIAALSGGNVRRRLQKARTEYELLTEEGAVRADVRSIPDILLRSPAFDERPVCLFVTWTNDGRFWPNVLQFCADIRSNGYLVFLLVANDRPDLRIVDPGPDIADGILVRANHGYDFALWASALLSVPRLWDQQALLFVNDSSYHSKVRLGETLKRMRESNLDAIGLTESLEVETHIQSYFFMLKRRALTHPAVREFWDGVRSNSSKLTVIRDYETTMHRRFRDGGLASDVLFRLDVRLSKNPTHYFWRELIAAGFPLVKTQLLRENPTGRDLRGWALTLEAAGFDLDQILVHLGAGVDRRSDVLEIGFLK